jgi:hypothetical protein
VSRAEDVLVAKSKRDRSGAWAAGCHLNRPNSQINIYNYNTQQKVAPQKMFFALSESLKTALYVPWTDVMIFKEFSPKNSAKKWRF